MAMSIYQIWDAETGNLVREYDTEASAWGSLRMTLARQGPAALADLSLAMVNSAGYTWQIAEGAALIKRLSEPLSASA